MSQNQFDALVHRVGEPVIIDPDEVLETDRRLLKINQATLGGMCPTRQKAWAAEVEASRSVRRKEYMRQRAPVHRAEVRDTDTEGSAGDEP